MWNVFWLLTGKMNEQLLQLFSELPLLFVTMVNRFHFQIDLQLYWVKYISRIFTGFRGISDWSYVDFLLMSLLWVALFSVCSAIETITANSFFYLFLTYHKYTHVMSLCTKWFFLEVFPYKMCWKQQMYIFHVLYGTGNGRLFLLECVSVSRVWH